MPGADTNGIPIDVAELAGVVAEGILYGAFSILFGTTIHILTRRRNNGDINLPMFICVILMMALATSQIIVDTVNVFWAFLNHDDPLQRQFFLEDATQPIFAAKHAIYFTMMLLGDSIVIYRCFIVWSRNYWVVVVPALCSLGSAVSAYQTIWAVRHIESATIASETKWGIAVLTLSMSANIIATSLLAYRIWVGDKALRESLGRSSGYTSSGSSHRRVLKIIMESGVVNAAYLVAYTTVLVVGNHGLEIMAGISTPLIGIIFTVVIIRAALASERQATMAGSSHALPLARRKTGGVSDTTLQITVNSDIEHGESMEMKGFKLGNNTQA
ncbi:hypothetical protein C8J57DRAFT_1732610 [Mycena rebaudengoi]|nr:hypothetical protein C8J57DRAFT_1732610 [Mycena rebaudengoi]